MYSNSNSAANVVWQQFPAANHRNKVHSIQYCCENCFTFTSNSWILNFWNLHNNCLNTSRNSTHSFFYIEFKITNSTCVSMIDAKMNCNCRQINNQLGYVISSIVRKLCIEICIVIDITAIPNGNSQPKSLEIQSTVNLVRCCCWTQLENCNAWW